MDREEFLLPKQIAETLGISYDKALLLVKTEIPHVKIGRKYLVRSLKFRQWYKAKEKERL